jgi:hypothetical protein
MMMMMMMIKKIHGKLPIPHIIISQTDLLFVLCSIGRALSMFDVQFRDSITCIFNAAVFKGIRGVLAVSCFQNTRKI